jgi:hypothetical protein
MPDLQDALWFKSEFQPAIERALAGTPLNVDMITAFACQETGEIWPVLRRQGLPTARILELCVGDTIDASPTGGGRRAFPKTKAELLSVAGGDRMFAVARQGLVDMAAYIPAYRGAASRPDKFCHGFGIFQLDLQFFKVDPDYFLDKRYADFDAALAKCTGELLSVLKRLGWMQKASLTDQECAGVAIAYNTGRYDPDKGLKQGYFDGSKYYGENYFAYLQMAQAAKVPAPAPATRGGPKPPTTALGKAGANKAVVDKAVAREASVAAQASGKKVVGRKAVAKKAVAKKVVAKKAPATKTAAGEVRARGAAVTKAAAKKAVKKAAARRPVAGKAASKPAAPARPASRKPATRDANEAARRR